MAHKPKIGIIGGGFVGGAIARGYALTADVKIYDKDPKRSAHAFEEVCDSEFIFLCLPTPMTHVEGGQADLKIINSVCQQLKDSDTSAILIIKSTVPIGTTNTLRGLYGLPIIHNPEFLTARNADIDFITPSRTVLGGTEDLTCQVAELFTNRFPGNNILEMTSNESEAVKYVANCFFATKVIYFNEVFLGLKGLGLDWKKVMSGVLTDGRIGNSHFEVPGFDGKLGFGGACVLPDAQVRLKLNVNGSETEMPLSEESCIKFLSAAMKVPTENDDHVMWSIESTDADMAGTNFKKVIKVTSRDVDEELYEFHTKNGVFTCTGEHLMPVMREDNQILITAKEIKESDELFSK